MIGDTIKMATKTDSADFPGMEMTLTRAGCDACTPAAPAAPATPAPPTRLRRGDPAAVGGKFASWQVGSACGGRSVLASRRCDGAEHFIASHGFARPYGAGVFVVAHTLGSSATADSTLGYFRPSLREDLMRAEMPARQRAIPPETPNHPTDEDLSPGTQVCAFRMGQSLRGLGFGFAGIVGVGRQREFWLRRPIFGGEQPRLGGQ